MDKFLLNLLCCPNCDSKLNKWGNDVENFLLYCQKCNHIYPVVDGIIICCDDLRKNKEFEIKILDSFIGKISNKIDEKIMSEMKRIESLESLSQWEWEDVIYWDKKYQDKFEKKESFIQQDQFIKWRDRLWQRKPLIEKLKLFQNELISQENKILLDIGCGESQNLQLFKDFNIDYRIACDMSFFALKLSKYYDYMLGFQKSLFILCPADHIPISPESVCIIGCFGILHHTPERENTLCSINALLKPGGFLILHEAVERQTFTSFFRLSKEEVSAHEGRINRISLKNTLKKLGLNCLMIEEGHSIILGFGMRFLKSIILRKEWIFSVFLKIDSIFIKIFGWIHQSLGPGDIRGLYQKSIEKE